MGMKLDGSAHAWEAVGRRGKVGFGTRASIGSAEERGCGREKKRSDAWGPHGREREEKRERGKQLTHGSQVTEREERKRELSGGATAKTGKARKGKEKEGKVSHKGKFFFLFLILCFLAFSFVILIPINS